ncbi:MAG TPA: hypothetical protein VLA34_00505, partial [Candidatus Krumholzibacterium sp.]|nr:hypothetical protein [Candidatus Krumholzibacterium sp.]
YDTGKDFKRQYEEYCDEHWSEERFLEQHPVCYGLGGCVDWEEYNEVGPQMQKFFFIYIPRELDREEFYENCGKYDAFAFGWDDWDQEYWLTTDQTHETFKTLTWTDNRTYYWSLRDESDKYLIRADRFVMGAIINRVVSMIDAAWLAYAANRGTPDIGGVTLDIVPGMEKSTIGLSYRF